MTLEDLIEEMNNTRKAMVSELTILNGKRDQLREDIAKLVVMIAHAEEALEKMKNNLEDENNG